ncbi:zeta toxin family protein [Streptomyces sp. NPDC090077]|uniref:zeta toxin family protein n=1 Tax=Streptomyces sp. NPDC090077 TaxID=3365938 RepID=UPI00382A351C
MFDELMAADDATAGAYTSIDGNKWMEKSEAYAIEQRFDIIMESAMRDPRDFEEPAARLWAANYWIEVPVVAVHDSESSLGALDRDLQQVDAFGQGRKIDPAGQVRRSAARGRLPGPACPKRCARRTADTSPGHRPGLVKSPSKTSARAPSPWLCR